MTSTSSKMLTATSPAKLNLFFEVYGRRPDGFHDVASLTLPIDLYDTLQLRPCDAPTISLRCVGSNPDLPTDSRNLVVQALELLKQKTGYSGGAKAILTKRIPTQAGLGGGSSNAVAALRLANQAWNLNRTEDELTEMSAAIGSDCPLFFERGPCLGRGRGEKIVPVSLSEHLSKQQLHFVLLKPAEGLSTAKVFARCMENHDGQYRDPQELMAALQSDVLELDSLKYIADRLFNRLEKPAAEIWPGFHEIQQTLLSHDFLAVRMTGSGTTFYGLCRDESHANRLAENVKQNAKQDWRIFVAKSYDPSPVP